MEAQMKKIKSHTILFTEACPLHCRYCYLRDNEGFGKSVPLQKNEILDEIARIDKMDDPNEFISQLLLTGGEPFLYPDLIKEIITTYGDRFWYTFNTSGYCFDKEMLKFLSKYKVSFVLSVDGDDRLTNYLRPVKENKELGGAGYMKKLREVVPTLLYYFPQTPFRIIVNPRYVDTLYQQYLFAERLGFRTFTFILDFESRPTNVKNGSIPWSKKYDEILQEQLNKIVKEIIYGWENNIHRPTIIDVNNVVKFLLQGATFDVDSLPCQLFNGRSMLSMSNRSIGYCMSKEFPNMEDCRQELLKQYNECQGKCKKDPNCPAFEYCSYRCCPKNSLEAHGEFFNFDELECSLNKATYNAALLLLSLGNEYCKDSKYYQRYLKPFIKGGQ